MSHMLAGQVPEVPAHVRAPLQSALQSVPVCDFSPLQHYSGIMEKLAESVAASTQYTTT